MQGAVLFSSCVVALGSVIVGSSRGMDAGGLVCLGLLAGLVVMLVGGWAGACLSRSRV